MKLFDKIILAITSVVVIAATISMFTIKDRSPRSSVDRGPAILESRKAVAVIDTGIDLNEPKLRPYICEGLGKDFTGTGLDDTHGHGTNIAWNVMKGLDVKQFCVMPLKYYTSTGYSSNLRNEIAALDYAIAHHAVLINFSGGGDAPSEEETLLVIRALSNGIIMAVAAGNDGSDLDQRPWYPACATKNPNFHVVGSLDDNGKKLSSSNYGPRVTDWALGLKVYGPKNTYMTGTSQATANVSNKLLKEMK